MDVLEHYNVRFKIENIHGKIKIMHSNNEMLDAFVFSVRGINDLNSLIAGLEVLLDGKGTEIELPTQSMYIAVIDPLRTKIYGDVDAWCLNPEIDADADLPTSHFKEIIVAWRDFISK
jgi:hypothetical protein